MKHQDKNEASNNVTVENNYGNVTNYINSRQVNKYEVNHDPATHITPAEAEKIREKIADLVLMLSSKDPSSKPRLFAEVHNKFKKKFQINKYSLLPKESFDDAIKWLNRYKGGTGRKTLKRYDPNTWTTETCKSIYSKAHELNIDHDTVLSIATQILHKSTFISSLKELNKKELETVYNYFFSKKK